jgi:PTS system nitrogen regulatory IIA component
MHPHSATSSDIARYLSSNDIWLDLKVTDKRGLFDAIGRHLEREHGLSHDLVVASLSRRELAGSTAVGEGVAIPHARISGLDRILVAYARLASPIRFNAPDGEPVTHVLVLLVPNPAVDEHLKILAEAAHLFSDRQFREQLAASADPDATMQLFSTWTKGV